MLIRVNKKISASKSVKYAALSTGTIDHVWYDEDSASARTGKRTNRIRMTRDMSVKSTTMDTYDA